jgi:hypothetical protein
LLVGLGGVAEVVELFGGIIDVHVDGAAACDGAGELVAGVFDAPDPKNIC